MNRLRVIIILITAVSLTSVAAPKRKPAQTINVEALTSRVLAALDACDIDAADDVLDEWSAALKRQKKTDSPELVALRTRKQLVENMLERVENVKIIERHTLSTDSLFNAFHIAIPLSPECGELYGKEWFAAHPELAVGERSTAHIPASEREVFWSAPHNGHQVIWSAGILNDGSYDNPHPVFSQSDFDDDSDMLTPYLSSDGLTLYFSAKISDSSIGDYDIFKAVRTGVGKSFSAPTNLGMPYNSTHFDGFYCTDEHCGVAYFVTNRSIADTAESMTLYTIIPNETRINRDVEFDDPTCNLTVDSLIDNFLPSTWGDDFNREAYLSKVSKLRTSTVQPIDASEFSLYIPKAHRHYTSFNDFKSQQARHEMENYLDALNELGNINNRLSDLRRRYSTDSSLATAIRQAETEQAQKSHQLIVLRNSVIDYESRAL